MHDERARAGLLLRADKAQRNGRRDGVRFRFVSADFFGKNEAISKADLAVGAQERTVPPAAFPLVYQWARPNLTSRCVPPL